MAIHHVEGECSYVEVPPSAIDRLNSRINSTNARVSQITPYISEKTAYIGDTEVEFPKAKDGIITVTVIDEDGQQIPCEMQIAENIKVVFEPLEKVATVSISIQ